MADFWAVQEISIHALREEGDYALFAVEKWACYFYPRPPRGGRPQQEAAKAPKPDISIHALREEGDNIPVDDATVALAFLSTPSARRATLFFFWFFSALFISIHALREEGDRGRT